MCIRDRKVFANGKRIECERAYPWEVLVDDWDARHGDPRNLYHVRTVDKGVLLAKFGQRRKGESRDDWQLRVNAIDRAGSTVTIGEFDRDDGQYSTVERVRIVEAWHLPSEDDMDEPDGRHVIAIFGGNLTLIDEPWERDYFPFCVLHYSDPVVGYWGQGLVEQLEGFQTEINEMSGKISDAHNVLGGGIIFMPSTSGVIDSHVKSGLGVIIKHLPGQAPTFYNPQPVHPQTYERLRDLPQDALADVGVSAMSAQSQKPAGIES